MKTARELVDELALNHSVSIASAGIFDRADVQSHRQQRLLFDAVGGKSQKREDFLHSHPQLMRGSSLKRCEP
jgi:hypothetical protein